MLYVYIYIYIERDACIYVYMHTHMCVYIYIYIHTYIIHTCYNGVKKILKTRCSQKCTGKGIGRQGVVLKHGDSLQKELMPCRPMPLPVQTWYSSSQYATCGPLLCVKIPTRHRFPCSCYVYYLYRYVYIYIYMEREI